jgi:hypothetical protein
LSFVPILAIGSLCSALAAAACTRPPRERVSGVYAHDSRALLRLDHDYDGDGRVDVRSYMRDGRPVRLEADGNGDRMIDRWEYYGRDGLLLAIGGSTRGDGREDTWVHVEGARRIVDISTGRDGRVDRRETYDGEMLVHTQVDTNHDGLPDRWEEFRNGALAYLLLDPDQRHGRATRRLVYSGRDTVRIEADEDGDGAWEAVDAAR